MKIAWNANPLATVVELDDADRVSMRLRIEIEYLKDRMAEASDFLDGGCCDTKSAVRALNPEDSDITAHILFWVALCEDALRGEHSGDCTCVPMSCIKCAAERAVAANTISGLDTYGGAIVQGAFSGNAGRIGAMALIAATPAFDPAGPWKGSEAEFRAHLPRWQEDRRRLREWLDAYYVEHPETTG